MTEISISTEVPNIVWEIEYDGQTYIMRWHLGVWSLTEKGGDLVLNIGKRERWTKALADALDHLNSRSV